MASDGAAIHHYKRVAFDAVETGNPAVVELSRADRENVDHSTLDEFDALDWLQFWLPPSDWQCRDRARLHHRR